MVLLFAFLCAARETISKLVQMRPIKVRGSIINKSEKSETPSLFLGREKLEVLETDAIDASSLPESSADTAVTICDVIPIPIPRRELYENIVNIFSRDKRGSRTVQVDKPACVSAASVLLNRDKGFFDNLPFVWRKSVNSRKEFYR